MPTVSRHVGGSSAAAEAARAGRPLYTLRARRGEDGDDDERLRITTSGRLREEFVRGTFPVKYRWVRHADTAACGVTARWALQRAESGSRARGVVERERPVRHLRVPSARALSRLSRVNRCARPPTRCEDLWRRLCRLEFGVVPSPRARRGVALYQHLHARRRDLLRRSVRARTLSASDLRIPAAPARIRLHAPVQSFVG